MNLHLIDVGIIVFFLAMSVLVGYWVSHRASRDTKSYFLGGNVLPWYMLGVSNASGMFDIAGTMLLVTWLFIYGMKSVWIPWLWPVFNQIFLMVYLSGWLRRSGVTTGAEWIKIRFGDGLGAQLSHLIVVVFALVSVIGFLSYGFKGIGKFAVDFLPWHFTADAGANENIYALILVGITTFYVVKGGMFSVVITEVMQFTLLSIASVAIGLIAMNQVSPGTLHHFVPAGWDNIFFGWQTGLDWSKQLPAANAKIIQDGFSLFGFLWMMLLFKGFIVAAAGPAPNYDMQRILSTRNPREACMMSAVVNVVLNVPRYFMVAGLTILALVYYNSDIRAMGVNMDFEKVLPDALSRFVPAGLLGITVAGLLAAFMSNLAATVNAAPPYIVNDIYRRFINPNASERLCVKLSYVASFSVVAFGIAIGWFVASINDVVQWIVSGLWGGYAAANVIKWYWWRFNGFGYFWGMATGIGVAMVVLLPFAGPWQAEILAASAAMPALHAAVVTLATLPSAFFWFPFILAASLVGCFVGTWLSKAEDMEVLKAFYKRTRPWGFWGPVLKAVQAEDPAFRPNPDFFRDMFNIVVGVVWQTALVAMPVYVVIREYQRAEIALAIVVATSLILWVTWLSHLKKAYPDSDNITPVPRVDAQL
ncbi:MAG: Na+:solute symporter [Alphaproteobacteria bacterium]|nr:Na+:solute symporter [Alphaproteobacteria bacterium]